MTIFHNSSLSLGETELHLTGLDEVKEEKCLYFQLLSPWSKLNNGSPYSVIDQVSP